MQEKFLLSLLLCFNTLIIISKNKNFTAIDIKNQIFILNAMFRMARKVLPYYSLLNSDVISLLEITLRNQAAHFQNQNFIVRLFSVLQYFGVYNNFDENKYLNYLY